MISIIISSVDKKMLGDVCASIKATIGVPHEILTYENSGGERGICAVYNQGMRDAQYDILCFMHEDIIIKTPDWGTIVTDIFKADPQIGLIGVAGCTYKSLTPGGWLPVFGGTAYSNIIQSFKYGQQASFHDYRNPDNKKLVPVISVDGLWLCIPRPIALEVQFDEHLLRGFHGYDIDISLAVGQKHKVVVTFDVLMEHLSEGKLDKTWMKEILKLHKKWSNNLPVTVEGFSAKQMINFEKDNFKSFLKTLKQLGLPTSTAFKTLWINSRFISYNFKLFLKLNYYALLSCFKQ